MTSVRETFDEEMMNILKYTFKHFMFDDDILREDQDINDDDFWHSWFPTNTLRLLSPPGWMAHAEQVPIIMETSHPRLTPDVDIIKFMSQYNYHYDRYISMDDNIGNFLFYTYVYHDLYKDQLRQWAQEMYSFSPK